MKTRSKLLLAAVSLLTVSVAATATSAYAWYTANRQVEAKVNSLGVHSTTGSLTIEHDTTIKQTKTDSKLKDTAGPTGAYLGWLRLQDFINNYCRYINTLIERYNAGEDLEKLEQQAILNYVLNWNKMLAENGLEYVR